MLHIHVMYMSRSNLDILLIFRSSVLDFKNTFYSRKKCNKNGETFTVTLINVALSFFSA